jgi:hypothetical protein
MIPPIPIRMPISPRSSSCENATAPLIIATIPSGIPATIRDITPIII